MKTHLSIFAALIISIASLHSADLTTILEDIDLSPTGTWDFTGGTISVNDADLPSTLLRADQVPDLDAYQLLFAGVPSFDWATRQTYGPAGILDPRLDWSARILSGAWTIDSASVSGLTVLSSINLPPDSIVRTHIADDAVGPAQLDQLGNYTATSLSLTDVLRLSDIDADPANPAPGESVIWLSSGAGSGSAGDLMIKVNSGGTTKTITIVDYSAN